MDDVPPPTEPTANACKAIVETTQPGDSVQLVGALPRPVYVRVIERTTRGLRVAWQGLEFLAVGRREGVTIAGAIWAITAFEPWAVAPPVAPPRRRRRAKGAPRG